MHLNPLDYILIVSTILEFNPLFQAVKSVKTKSVKGVSVFTFISILTLGTLWLVYGITLRSLPLIIGNAVKLFTSLTVVLIYLKYRSKK